MLAAAGISRQDCYITNVVNERPANNNFNIFYTDAKRTKPTPELCAHRTRVQNELAAVHPRVVVALGEEALKATAYVTGISTYRGTIIETARQKVLPTFHPAYVMRAYGERPVVELDLKKAFRQALRPFTPEMNFQVAPTLTQILDFLAQRHTPVAFDIESIGPCTRSLGFAWSPTDAISIPLIWKGSSCWSAEDELLIIQALNPYLASSEIAKYLQNAPYDCTIIAKELGLHVEGITLDTMYAHHLLYSELPKGLDFLSSIYTDFPMYWGGQQHVSDEANARYNCYDCCATWIAAQAILGELKEREMDRFYRESVHPVIFALTRMQNRGIKVDEAAKEVVRTSTQQKLDEARSNLAKLLGFDLNPNSPKQVKELVYNRWKLPVQRNPRTKVITTDDDALRSLGRKFPQYAPILRNVVICRQTRKLISSYIDAKLDNGRARTSYGHTVSGRISSSATWDGFGGNLQNIPRGDFRRLYVANEGKVLIKADLKQAEYMVFCWDAPVPELIIQYTTNPTFDVHLLNAKLIFGLDPAQVTKERRFEAKQGVYAGNYQIGPLKMSRMYDLEFKRAKFILERYRAVRPELELWWEDIEYQIRTTRKIRNPHGRERIFFDRMDQALFRKAFNHLCQSTVADIINAAVVTLDRQGADLLLQVHDEIVLQCDNDPDMIAKTVRQVRAAMEIPIRFPKTDVPLVIPAEIAVGPNWYDVVPYKEPLLCLSS